jgi:hypothetical protein
MSSAPDPDLANLLQAERSTENARRQLHAKDAQRHRGVSWSGLSPGPFEPRPEATLREAAEERFTARHAWRTAPAGRFLSAIAQAQQTAAAAHAVGEAARASVARNFEAELQACAAAAEDLERHAQALIVTARLARDAVMAARS